MRASISGHVTLRPVRLGLIIEPTLPELLRAVIVASGHWGGVTWPIVPAAHDADECCRLGEAFDVDALVAITETEAAREASKREGFSWAGGDISPFTQDPVFRDIRPLEVRSLLPPGRDGSALMRVTWDITHPLAALCTCTFGELGDPPLPEERAEVARRASQFDLGSSDPFPMRLTPPWLIWYTARDLRLGDRWSGAGFVVVDPDSAEDLAWYWNVRAVGNAVWPWPRRNAEFVASAADDWVKHLVEQSAVGRDEGIQLVVWSRDREIPADLREIIERHQATTVVAGIDHIRLVAEDRPPPAETQHSRRFDLELDDDASSARIAMPSLPFVEGLPWWNRVGYVVADVHVSTEFNMRAGYRVTAPPVRWLSRSLVVVPIPIEPIVRPIADGVAKAVEASSDYVTVWFVSSEALLTQVFDRASLAPCKGSGRRLMARLIEMLGGLPGINANQPAVREVLEAARRSPYGKPVAALVEEVRRHAGGWENNFMMRGEDYPTRVLTSLAHTGMLTPVLRFDCLACGSANALPGDLIRESLRCQLCREERPLATYVAARQKLRWHLAVPQHLPLEQLRETYPVMASISVIQGPHHMLEVPHLVLSTQLVVDGTPCEIDFAAFFDIHGIPSVVVSETKATAGQIEADDVAHLKAVQKAIRATGIDCYILIAKLAQSLTDDEKRHLRSLCEGPVWPVRWPAGMARVPVCPIVFLHRDLSVYSFHEDHPWRQVKHPATIAGLAEASCQRHLGLTGWRSHDYGPIWNDT